MKTGIRSDVHSLNVFQIAVSIQKDRRFTILSDFVQIANEKSVLAEC